MIEKLSPIPKLQKIQEWLHMEHIKHSGNNCNLMAEILITRYEHFVENNTIMHITTNLFASEIEKA